MIRVNKEVDFVEDNFITPYSNEKKQDLNLFAKDENCLDVGCVEWSEIEDEKKMEIECDFDKQLRETIRIVQL